MSYKQTYIQRESSMTRELGEMLDEREERSKASPSVRTVGFNVGGGGGGSGNTTPISIPQSSNSNNNSSNLSSSSSSSLGKSPSARSSYEKSNQQHGRKLSNASQSPSSSTDSLNNTVNNNNNSNVSVSLEIPKTTAIPDVSQLSISNSTDSGVKKQQQQQQQQGQKKQQQQQGQKQQQQQGQKQQQQGQKQQQQQQKQGQKQQGQQGGQQQQNNPNNNNTPTVSSPNTMEEDETKKKLLLSSGSSTQFDDPKRRDKLTKKKIINATPALKQVPLFAHLPQFEIENSLGVVSADIHPEIISLGLKYANFTISGSNARAVALMTTLKQVIHDFHIPADKEFSRELNQHINPLIQFLVDCRPMSISMRNCIVYLKQKCLVDITKLRISNEESKIELCKRIDEFIHTIVMADSVIAQYGVSKISDGDVILTYASSHVVEQILTQAQEKGKKFRVIVVDSRPKHEGKELLHRLVEHGVKCTYILINAISYMMKEVTKVFVGASSVLSNGSLISRSGTALVASMAKFYNVPFIVCCETYKFTEIAQLDAICSNELGDPWDLVSNLSEKDKNEENILKDWKTVDHLNLLNLMYDLTPIELIAMVITEFGMVPPTSIPVILREYRKEIIN